MSCRGFWQVLGCVLFLFFFPPSVLIASPRGSSEVELSLGGAIPLPLGAGALAAFQGVGVYSYLSDCFWSMISPRFLLPVVTAAFAPGDPVHRLRDDGTEGTGVPGGTQEREILGQFVPAGS